jgi:hypothetical protein
MRAPRQRSHPLWPTHPEASLLHLDPSPILLLESAGCRALAPSLSVVIGGGWIWRPLGHKKQSRRREVWWSRLGASTSESQEESGGVGWQNSDGGRQYTREHKVAHTEVWAAMRQHFRLIAIAIYKVLHGKNYTVTEDQSRHTRDWMVAIPTILGHAAISWLLNHKWR